MSANEIIRLNVGGTRYEVARSTIQKYPDTMLARLISDTWNQEDRQQTGEDKEIFLDADGLHFRFVIEFMRHQQVNLPLNVAKASVLKDLEYFGFNVPPQAIDTRGTNIEVAKHIRTLAEHKRKESEALRRTASISDFAHTCFKKLIEGPETLREVRINDYAVVSHLNSKSAASAEAELNEHLSDYGLRYESHGSTSITVVHADDA